MNRVKKILKKLLSEILESNRCRQLRGVIIFPPPCFVLLSLFLDLFLSPLGIRGREIIKCAILGGGKVSTRIYHLS
jgi:hypothetical protein